MTCILKKKKIKPEINTKSRGDKKTKVVFFKQYDIKKTKQRRFLWLFILTLY